MTAKKTTTPAPKTIAFVECRRAKGYVARIRFTNGAPAKGYEKIITAWAGKAFAAATFAIHYTEGAAAPVTFEQARTVVRDHASNPGKGVTPIAATPAGKKLQAVLSAKPAPLALKPSPGPCTVYTVGYDGGLQPEGLAEILAERKITHVIDTRADRTGRGPWSGAKLKEQFEARYVVAQSLPEVIKACRAVGTSILIRKDEAPGDNAFHMEIARALAPFASVVHLYRNEQVTGPELERAIKDGNDYDCEIDDVETEMVA